MKKNKLTTNKHKAIVTFYVDNKPYMFYSNNYRRQIKKSLLTKLLNGLEKMRKEYLEAVDDKRTIEQ